LVTGDWQSFIIVQVGASAALTGLVFVALSINLRQIIDHPSLVGRAGEALLLLIEPVFVGMVLLAPFGHLWAAGVVVSAIAFPIWAWVTSIVRRDHTSSDRPASVRRVRVAAAEVALAPWLIGAVLLLASQRSGFAFLAAGAVLSIGAGILDGWVLLVEILR
jgi:hypothetical protein